MCWWFKAFFVIYCNCCVDMYICQRMIHGHITSLPNQTMSLKMYTLVYYISLCVYTNAELHACMLRHRRRRRQWVLELNSTPKKSYIFHRHSHLIKFAKFVFIAWTYTKIYILKLLYVLVCVPTRMLQIKVILR